MKLKFMRSLRVVTCAGTLLAGTVAVLPGQEPEPYEAKSPTLARRLSIIGTALPLAVGYALDKGGYGDEVGPVVVGGLILGPVLGYVYAGEAGRGMAQAGLRAAVMGATAGVMIAICSRGGCDPLQSLGAEAALAVVVAVAGGVYTGMLIMRDIDGIGDRVRARNQRLGAISVLPTYFPESRAAGLVLTWRH